MDGGGASDGQRPAFKPGAVKAEQRESFAEAAFRRNPCQHDHCCDGWRQHGHRRLASPIHGTVKATATASASVIP